MKSSESISMWAVLKSTFVIYSPLRISHIFLLICV